jgi:RNA polymerase sigma-70 factor (ECF subfamily)
MRNATLASKVMASRRRALPSEVEDFRIFFDRYHRQVLAYCRRRTPQAQDAAAEVFLVVWRRHRGGDLADLGLPWLYGIARKILANQRRAGARQRRAGERLAGQPPKGVLTPEEAVIATEEQQRVRSALDSLRPNDREVIRLALWEDLDHAAIGEVLGTSARAASMRLSRAIARLEARLTETTPVIGGEA